MYQKSRLTTALKIYSVLVLIYSIYRCISLVYNSLSMSFHPYILLNNAETLCQVVIYCITVIVIYRKKQATAMFLPCLLMSIIPLISLIATAVMMKLSFADILFGYFWEYTSSVVFMLIAIDMKRDSKHLMVYLITLIVFTLLESYFGIVSTIISLSRISANTSQAGFHIIESITIVFFVLSHVLSPTLIIILFLCRILIWRKKSRIPILEDGI